MLWKLLIAIQQIDVSEVYIFFLFLVKNNKYTYVPKFPVKEVKALLFRICGAEAFKKTEFFKFSTNTTVIMVMKNNDNRNKK